LPDLLTSAADVDPKQAERMFSLYDEQAARRLQQLDSAQRKKRMFSKWNVTWAILTVVFLFMLFKAPSMVRGAGGKERGTHRAYARAFRALVRRLTRR
jgi:hypothetical protein